jgi:hypothetical protein
VGSISLSQERPGDKSHSPLINRDISKVGLPIHTSSGPNKDQALRWITCASAMLQPPPSHISRRESLTSKVQHLVARWQGRGSGRRVQGGAANSNSTGKAGGPQRRDGDRFSVKAKSLIAAGLPLPVPEPLSDNCGVPSTPSVIVHYGEDRVGRTDVVLTDPRSGNTRCLARVSKCRFFSRPIWREFTRR